MTTEDDCPIDINTMISLTLPPDTSSSSGADLPDHRFGPCQNDVESIDRDEDEGSVLRPLYYVSISSVILTHYYKVKDDEAS